METEKQYLFKIDNTKKLLMETLFWYLFFLLFCLVLWMMFTNLNVNANKSWSELFIQEISDPRFSSILVILLIVGPISTVLAIKKLLQSDNNMYFFKEKIIYKNIDYHEIGDIKNGCCPFKGGRFLFLIVLVLGGWIVIPLRIWDILWFYILKIIGHNDMKNIKHNFIVIDKQQDKPLVGAIFNDKELKQLLNYKKTYTV